MSAKRLEIKCKAAGSDKTDNVEIIANMNGPIVISASENGSTCDVAIDRNDMLDIIKFLQELVDSGKGAV